MSEPIKRRPAVGAWSAPADEPGPQEEIMSAELDEVITWEEYDRINDTRFCTIVYPYQCDVCERVYEHRSRLLPDDIPSLDCVCVPHEGMEMVAQIFEGRCDDCVAMCGERECDCGEYDCDECGALLVEDEECDDSR
jgi:hypothetical protein